MTSATVTRGGRTAVVTDRRPGAGRRRRALTWLLVVTAVLVIWEGVKFLGGTPWRAPGSLPGPDNPILWNPPFR